MFSAAYLVLLAFLFVRVRDPEELTPLLPEPAEGEAIWLVALHHFLFYALLASALIEGVVAGAYLGSTAHALGALIMALGVAGYRSAGDALGSALSPFIEPRPGAPLVTRGLYRYLRHPMYLSQALIAVGAVVTMGAKISAWLLAPIGLVLVVRAALEEAALARVFPDYRRHGRFIRTA